MPAALVDTITLEEVSIMLSATEYVLGGQFVQSGVTIELTVQARDAMGELCDPLMDMFDIPGGEWIQSCTIHVL